MLAAFWAGVPVEIAQEAGVVLRLINQSFKIAITFNYN